MSSIESCCGVQQNFGTYVLCEIEVRLLAVCLCGSFVACKLLAGVLFKGF